MLGKFFLLLSEIMSKKSRYEGKITVHVRGFGFVSPNCGHDDIFIPSSKIKGALDGDVVTVGSLKKGPKGWEGAVISIKEPGKKQLAGTVVDFYGKHEAVVFAPSLGEERPIILSTKTGPKLNIGDRLLIKITRRGQDQVSYSLKEVLGNIDQAEIDSNVAIQEYDIRHIFPATVLNEAKKMPKKCVLTDDRLDLRKLECITIDPTTARDFDDALTITKDNKGCYHLGVHIADVSHYVKDGSKIDQEAQKRCNSTYFIDKVVPMLPEELSNDLCSLKEGVDRYTASVLMKFDAKGVLKEHKITKALIRSDKRFTYEEAKQVLDRKLTSPHLKMLRLLVELCNHLKKQKKDRGCVELSMPEIRMVLDEQSIPYTEDWIEYDITHQLVEEFMLKANEVIATELMESKKQGVFRVHESPDQDNLKEFFAIAQLFGHTIPHTPSSQDIAKLFEDAKGSVYSDQLSVKYIRSMKLAIYSTDNIGHYGLNLANYTHFTSPIRRYSDLIVHRLIFEKNYKPDAKKLVALCSEKERNSFKAEMSVLRLKKLRYLDRLTEDDPEITFEATVTNVKPQGVFFDLSFIGFEGMVHVSTLGDEYFQYDESSRSFIGAETKHKYTIGTKMVVSLETIDLVFGECTWNVVH